MTKPDAPACTRSIPVEEIERELELATRVPFRHVLARLLNLAPSDDAIGRIAEKNPDRWAQTLAIVGRLAGYSEKLEVEDSREMRLRKLSDMELEMRLAALEGAVEAPGPRGG